MPAPKPDPASDQPPLNREQRRREKFGHGARTDLRSPDDPWPVQEVNPAFGSGGDDAEVSADRPHEDVTPESAPPTSDTTEEGARAPRQKGTIATKSAKG